MARCLVVSGGAGFIGSNTVKLSLTTGLFDAIFVLDNLYSGLLENLPSTDRVKAIVIDVAEGLERVEKLLKGYGQVWILHLAAIVSVDEAYRDPINTIRVNVMGTANLLELARRVDAQKFVYASSVAVYGEPEYLPIDEEHPLKPANLYGATKLMGEQLVRQYGEAYGLDYVNLRYFNVYGPNMRAGPYAGVVYKFITGILKKGEITIYGDGSQTRDFIYVEDVAHANLKALTATATGTYNIGTGIETSVKRLAQEVINAIHVVTGKRPHVKVQYAPPRKGDVKRSQADNSKARDRLNWTPKTSLGSGLVKTVGWLLARIQA